MRARVRIVAVAVFAVVVVAAVFVAGGRSVRRADPDWWADRAPIDLWRGATAVAIPGGVVAFGHELESREYVAAAAVLSVSTGRWSVPSPPPPGSFEDPTAIWTGQSVIVVGFVSLDGSKPLLRFFPDGGRWEILPPSPLGDRARSSVAWTRHKLVVWGGDRGRHFAGHPEGRFADDGAMFDPATGLWSLIPRGPLAGRQYAAIVSLGPEILVAGGDGDGRPVTRGDGAFYNVETGSWRPAPTLPVLPFFPMLRQVGSRTVLWSRAGEGYVLDGDRWVELPPPPIRIVRSPMGGQADGRLLAVLEQETDVRPATGNRGVRSTMSVGALDVETGHWAVKKIDDDLLIGSQPDPTLVVSDDRLVLMPVTLWPLDTSQLDSDTLLLPVDALSEVSTG